MFIPYTTDAPIYHWPIATVGLIVVNILVFAFVVVGGYGDPEQWMLWYGDGLQGHQWLLSIFMHADPMHLIGNILFLWLFGLIVEGKLGWWRFLCCYLFIGIGQSMVEQMVMLGAPEAAPGSMGASAAIFGLIAMAAIWAPINEITFFYWFYFRPGTFDVSIGWVAGLYAGWEVVMLCIFGTDAGSSWLHLGGFLLGLPLGIILLKRNIVDCEGLDAFHVWSGDYGAFKKEPDRTAEYAKLDAQKKEKEEQLLTGAQQQFRLYLQQGNADAAMRLYEKLKRVHGGLRPQRDEWLAIIQWLHSQKRWADSAPYMAQCIAAYPNEADAVRLKLAQICVVELQRPGRAIELIATLDRGKLSEKQIELAKRVRAKAQQMQSEGVVELDAEIS